MMQTNIHVKQSSIISKPGEGPGGKPEAAALPEPGEEAQPRRHRAEGAHQGAGLTELRRVCPGHQAHFLTPARDSSLCTQATCSPALFSGSTASSRLLTGSKPPQ